MKINSDKVHPRHALSKSVEYGTHLFRNIPFQQHLLSYLLDNDIRLIWRSKVIPFFMRFE